MYLLTTALLTAAAMYQAPAGNQPPPSADQIITKFEAADAALVAIDDIYLPSFGLGITAVHSE